MQFLENEGLDHIKPKSALKIMVDMLTCYINMDVPEFKSGYIGKLTSTDFSILKEAFYESLDMYGFGKLENTGELFGDKMAEILEERKSKVKKIATARVILEGGKSLVDYNWNVKMIQSSDMLRKAPSYVVQVEFLLMNERGRHERKIMEFSQEEFASFVNKLNQYAQ